VDPLGLVRAADLIGQLYLRKHTALFDEFRETGMSNKLGYNSVADCESAAPRQRSGALAVKRIHARSQEIARRARLDLRELPNARQKLRVRPS
jgi:hypothetical protein